LKITKVKDIENCFDGSFIKEIIFSDEITKDFIFFMRKNADLKYYPEFSRPFFKINIPDLFELKGVENNKSIRIVLKNDIQKSLKIFKNIILEFNDTQIRDADRTNHNK